MKALVINLDDAQARMDFMAGQLDRLSISWERLPAVTAETLSPPADDPYWTRWERPMRVTEMAALASHRAAWRQVLYSAAPHLVLEDDALLMPGVPRFLDAVAPLEEAEHVTLEERGRKKLMARSPHPAAPMRRLWQDRTGAAAYVLRPSGAAKLLARTDRAPGLADAVICAAYELSSWQADPALAIQLDQCERHGMTSPIAVSSSIGQVGRPSMSELPAAQRRRYRLRRLVSQIRMGLRQARHARGSQRRIVEIAAAEER